MPTHSAVAPELSILKRRIIRGWFRGIDSEGYMLVSFGEPESVSRCEILSKHQFKRTPDVGATLLILEGDRIGSEMPVVLGEIGRFNAIESSPISREMGETSDELVIEAKKNLTLKCGEGSITIREDGKILIKGKDLVSHAKRMNRIKGGSVSIN